MPHSVKSLMGIARSYRFPTLHKFTETYARVHILIQAHALEVYLQGETEEAHL